jgi:hypothetical protein
MPFVIAVPSYRRSEFFERHTYGLLKRHNLLALATVFVVEDELEAYRQKYPNIQVVVGVKGLKHQREFIYNHYPRGTHICMMDDDLQTVIDNTRQEVPDLQKVIQEGFDTAEKEDCRLWGIYPIDNPYFFKSGYSTNLKYIVGAFYGIINAGHQEPKPSYDDKEDMWRSCWYFKEDGKVIRLNHYAPKTRYYKNPGGINETRTSDTIRLASEEIKNMFPEYSTIFVRKGKSEIRLRR